MNTTIEKEMKTALTHEQYTYLLAIFNCQDQHLITQENYYFDTPQQDLFRLNLGLRIRLTADGGEYTLKEPLKKHQKLETTDYFTLAEGRQYVSTHTFPQKNVTTKLATYAIDQHQLKQIGFLKNERYEVTNASGLWVLDKSYFPSGVSYELEFEYAETPDAFFAFLKEHQLPLVKIPSKLARAVRRSKA